MVLGAVVFVIWSLEASRGACVDLQAVLGPELYARVTQRFPWSLGATPTFLKGIEKNGNRILYLELLLKGPKPVGILKQEEGRGEGKYTRGGEDEARVGFMKSRLMSSVPHALHFSSILNRLGKL
jgi:hypothetical protein